MNTTSRTLRFVNSEGFLNTISTKSMQALRNTTKVTWRAYV
jgi:hypothetical protein